MSNTSTDTIKMYGENLDGFLCLECMQYYTEDIIDNEKEEYWFPHCSECGSSCIEQCVVSPEKLQMTSNEVKVYRKSIQ